MWLAKQETLTPHGRLVSPLVLERNQGSLNVHYSSLLLSHGVDALVFFMWYIHIFFLYFSELHWIEYTVLRTDVTCDMWPSSDQSDL